MSSFKVVWTSKGRESREVGVKSWDPRGGAEGGAEVSEFASSTGRGGELGVGSLRLRRREGGEDIGWRWWNWIWSCCKGIGSDRG